MQMALAGMAKKLRQAKVDELKKSVEADPSHPIAQKMAQAGSLAASDDVFTAMKRPSGTVSILAEYKRKLAKSGFIRDMIEPRIMGGLFRDAGASVAAMYMDPDVGGCQIEDFEHFYKEQQSVAGDFPGPLPIIWHDLIFDEIQVAQAAAMSASAVTISWEVNGADRTKELVDYASSLAVESIVQVSSAESLQQVVDSGLSKLVAYMGCTLEEGEAAAQYLPKDRSVIGIVTVDVPNKPGEDLEEVAASWRLRDAGWGCIWASDILFRAGLDTGEDAKSIIKALKVKTSAKFGTPKALHGKGEGAKEYLGYLAM